MIAIWVRKRCGIDRAWLLDTARQAGIPTTQRASYRETRNGKKVGEISQFSVPSLDGGALEEALEASPVNDVAAGSSEARRLESAMAERYDLD